MHDNAYEDWIAENAAAHLRSLRDDSPPTRRVTLMWPNPETAGNQFTVVYLPPAVAVLFERLEAGASYEVTVRRKSS